MKDEILSHLDNPAQLEKLYRTNKLPFKREFTQLYPELKGNALADFWHERLHYESEEINRGNRNELVFVLLGALVAGVLAKLPVLLGLDETLFYTRNAGFLLFPFLTAYFAWKNQLTAGKVAFIAASTLAGLLFINLLPDAPKSDTLILSCVHLLLFLWCVLGYAFVGSIQNSSEKRLQFLKYNGDLVVITALIALAGGLLTGITIGLFSLIGFHIQEFWFGYIVVIGLPAAPLFGTYLIQANPQLVGRVSPVIARIFSPLVLVMLVVYLLAMVYSGKNPYNDREFLLIFNALLVGVMAIIFFAVGETAKSAKNTPEVWVLFLLSLLTIVVNGVALSAIVLRIAEGGFTPNRAAVLGSNVLILLNLLLVAVQLFRAVFSKGDVSYAGKAIAGYLPVYFAWTVVVTFLFPVLFNFQ